MTCLARVPRRMRFNLDTLHVFGTPMFLASCRSARTTSAQSCAKQLSDPRCADSGAAAFSSLTPEVSIALCGGRKRICCGGGGACGCEALLGFSEALSRCRRTVEPLSWTARWSLRSPVTCAASHLAAPRYPTLTLLCESTSPMLVLQDHGSIITVLFGGTWNINPCAEKETYLALFILLLV